MGIIALEGMAFYAHHGYYIEERKRGKNYSLDVVVHTDIVPSGSSDELEDTVNYEVLYLICEEEMESPKHLIESVAKSIADRINTAYPNVSSIQVKVCKLEPELGGHVNNAHVVYSIDNTSKK